MEVEKPVGDEVKVTEPPAKDNVVVPMPDPTLRVGLKGGTMGMTVTGPKGEVVHHADPLDEHGRVVPMHKPTEAVGS